MKKEKPLDLNKNLIDYLQFYFSSNNPQYAVLINGKWGSGKTFFIKNLLKQLNSKKNKTTIEKQNENITLKPLYISLYGLDNIEQINIKIREALNPLLYSKGAKIIKNIFLGAIKTATHINLDTDGDGKSDGKVSVNINSIGILQSSDGKIKGNKILIFDDLERCKVEINDLFGYINEFVEHHNCKVILLSDEGRIYSKNKGKRKSYEEFKEKLVGQTFTIKPDVDSAIEHFISQVQSPQIKDFFNSSIELTKSVFIASKVENLRILKQAVIDFERFIGQLEDQFVKNENYKDFQTNLLAYFLIVYIEYKSVNQMIAELDKYSYSEEEKKVNANIKLKYDEILNRFGIYEKSFVIRYGQIVDFIKNGYSNLIQLNESLKESIFFRNIEIQNWEYLWAWEELDDVEFDRIYNEVINDFFNSKFENPYILLHVFGILISLIKYEIIDEDKKDLMKSYKKQFKAILKKNEKHAFALISHHSWGRGYREKESVEFKDIHKFSNEMIINHNSHTKDDYLKNVFENLNDDNITSLNDKLDKSLPDQSTTYSFAPILTTVDGIKLSDQLLKFNNRNLDLFFHFIERRYFPEKVYSNGVLEPFNIDDKDCLEVIKKQFVGRLNEFGKVKQHNMKNYIRLLDAIITKLDTLESEENKKKK